MPNLAILMPTFNGNDYVEAQITSIQRQSIADWRLFISDDGSTDKTIETVTRLAKSDTRIQLLKKEKNRLGIRKNYEFLLKNTSADYYMFSDQDDVWFDNKIEVSLNEMKKQESNHKNNYPILVHSDLKMVDKDLKALAPSYYGYWQEKPSDRLNKNLTRCTVTGCTALFNKSLRDIYISNTEETDYKYVLHDYKLAILASIFGASCYINRPLVFYRRHGNNASEVKKRSFIRKLTNFKSKLDTLKNINRELSANLLRILEIQNMEHIKLITLKRFMEIINPSTNPCKKIYSSLKYKFLYDTLVHNLIWLISLI